MHSIVVALAALYDALLAPFVFCLVSALSARAGRGHEHLVDALTDALSSA